MKLINRQIKAVKKTLEQVMEEYEQGKLYHDFSSLRCPLCNIRQVGKPHKYCCEQCPVWKTLGMCSDIRREYGDGVDTKISVQDITGFLQSLLISLEEMK